jgi:hypothetical protein
MSPREKYLAGFQVLFGPGIPRGVIPEVSVTVGERTCKMIRCTSSTPVVGVVVKNGWKVAEIQPSQKYVWLAPNESKPNVGSFLQLLQEFLKGKGDGMFDLLLEFKREADQAKSKKDETFLDLLYKQVEVVGDTISNTVSNVYSSTVEYVTNIPKLFSR